MKRILMLITAIAVMLGGLAFMAPAANADTQTITIKAKVTGSAVASASATATAASSASAYSYAAAQVRSTRATTSTCFWSPGWNSYTSGGKRIWWYDPVPSKVCKLKKPFWTGGKKATHKKVGGGTSGAKCGNPFIPSRKPPSTTHGAILDVRSGTRAKVAVSAKAEVDVSVAVNVSLEYTYNGKTFTVTDKASATGHGEDTASDTASVYVTNSTTLKATGSAINNAKASVKTKATARAKAKAVANAQAKAEASVEVMIVINVETGEPAGPSVSVTPKACVESGQTQDVTLVVHNPTNSPGTIRPTFNGQVLADRPIGANASITIVIPNQPVGPFSGSVLLVEAGKSAAFSGVVEECPPPPDNAPVVNIMGSPAHLYVGGNAHIWIEASDPDGDAVSVQVSASGAGTVAGLVPSDVRWDGTPCPSGKSCYRATAWAGDAPGTLTITAKVTAGGKSATDSVSFPVKADEF